MSRPPAGGRGRWRDLLAHHAPVLFGLAALAVAQPLLDLYGANPETFLASGATRAEIVAFALVVTLTVPLVLVAVEAVVLLASERARGALHTGFVAVLGGGVALAALRRAGVDAAVPAVALAAAAGLALAWAEFRARPVRLLLRYLGVAAVLVPVVFLLGSRAARLVWEREAAAVEAAGNGRAREVVVIVFDELQLAGLLDEGGEIDTRRYPGFGRLARVATWYRNATSVAPWTEYAVPALLTGRMPDVDDLPFSADHPRNLFTLLGRTHSLDVTEMLTSLCPRSLCERAGGGTFDTGRFRSLLSDAAVVYGHRVLPPSLARDLPEIDDSWAGFLGEERIPLESGSDAKAKWSDRWRGSTPAVRSRLVEQMIARIGETPEPALHFVHVALPHVPWNLTPDGVPYPDARLPGVEVRAGLNGLRDDGRFVDDPFWIRQARQRYLLQLGALDRLVGALLDRLESRGLTDDTLLVVAADHGHTFVPDQHRRAPTDASVEDVYRVPLFVKLPGQRQGRVDDANVLTVDVLPTIAGALGFDVGWSFDGVSLLDGPPARATKPVAIPGSGPATVPPSLAGLLTEARDYAAALPHLDEGWRGVAAVGDHGDLVGRRVARVRVARSAPANRARIEHAGRFADVDPRSEVPLLVTGVVDPSGGPPPAEVLVALNGRIAGVGGGWVDLGGSRYAFSALLAPDLFRPGRNRVEIFEPVPGGVVAMERLRGT